MDNLVSSFDSRKLHCLDVGGRKDGISKLPDSILHHILSFLSTKDAIRTSILARRWKFLWTYLSDFNLEVRSSSIYKNETQNQTENHLLNVVDGLIQKAKYIKRFCFVVYGIPIDVDHVNFWISTLLKHKVQKLDLSLDISSSFVLANNLLAPESLNMLNLELGCVLKAPRCIHFPGLKTLTLSYVIFSDKASIEQLLSGCSVLQKLTLFYCNWKNIKNVDIKIPTVTTLIIKGDVIWEDNVLNCKLTIEAMNLVSLSCIDYLDVELIPINLTSLVDVYIDVSNGWSSLRQYAARWAIKVLSGICHVKSLILSKGSFLCRKSSLISRLPTFHSLTHLGVNQGMYDFTSEALIDILEKSPNLEVLDIVEGFDLDFCLNGAAWALHSVPYCFKSSLKSFSISNFDGSAAEMELLSFLC